ncbi:MAG: tRNA lysidine(34) synthetase TilS [Acidimicrobiales bacterium]
MHPALLLDRCRFPASGTPVTCAVSGGADSLALLVLACAAGLDVTAVHVDHGLREGSAEEAEVVSSAATRFGVAFRAERVEVGAGPNLEARARAARRAALGPGALTGHTADDQAETVLLNLLRGAGLDGLRGIPADETKPLLALRRYETHAVCSGLGLAAVDDPSNHDLALRRNRIRHEVLPALDLVAGRDVAAVFARQAALLADDAAALDVLADAIDPTDAGALAAAPIALARRAVRAWLRAGDERHPPDAATVERVLAVARGEFVACELSGGRRVARSGGRLSVTAATFPA